VEDEPFHVVSQIDQRDLGLGAGDPNRSDKQPHAAFLLAKDMLNPGTD